MLKKNDAGLAKVWMLLVGENKIISNDLSVKIAVCYSEITAPNRK